MIKKDKNIVLTLSELRNLTGISDATVSRLRGEKEPIRSFNINLLKKRVNDEGIKIVTDEDLRLIIIYKIYSHIPTSNGRFKHMKDSIEELNLILSDHQSEEVIERLKKILQQKIECLEKLKNTTGDNLLHLIKTLEENKII